MSLVLVGGNADNTVMVADGRLLTGTDVFDDGFAKLVAVSTPRARFGVAFAGLANAPWLRMSLWLPEALAQAALADNDPDAIVEGVRDRLDEVFAKLPKSIDADTRRTVLNFAGYTYNDASERQMFQRGIFNHAHSKPGSGPFVIDADPEKERFNYVAAIPKQPLPDAEIAALGKLVNEHRPPSAVVGKAVDIIQTIAGEATDGGVGPECSSMVIPSDRSLSVRGEYHAASPSERVFMPGLVNVDEHGNADIIAQAALVSGAVDRKRVQAMQKEGEGKRSRSKRGDRPIAYPRVRRNAPCPCGSGRKYKLCHGR